MKAFDVIKGVGNPEGKRILFFIADFSGCAHYRILIPMFGLQKTERYNCKVDIRMNDSVSDWKPDVIVIPRQHKPEVFDKLVEYKKLGAKIVYDTDDNLFNIYPTNPVYKAFQAIKKDMVKIVNLCDLVTVSTEPLKEVYSKVHKNVVVLPNQILPTYSMLKIPNNGDKIRIGWAGSNTHYSDFKECESSILSILKNRDDVTFVFFGWIPSSIAEEFKIRMGESPIITPKIEFHPFVPIEQYHLRLGAMKLDIGLAPLIDATFNESKSNLKVLEYGVMGIPTIASDVYPYHHTIENGVDGILVRKSRQWEKSITSLLDNKQSIKIMGDKVREKVLSKFNMITNTPLWEEAYFGGKQ